VCSETVAQVSSASLENHNSIQKSQTLRIT